jgi:DNA-binding transcriptional regulator YhcF (GntR family)
LTEAGLLTVRRGEGTFVAERSDEERVNERRQLLAKGAQDFIRVAYSVGATRKQAEATLSECWRTLDLEGKEEVRDE